MLVLSLLANLPKQLNNRHLLFWKNKFYIEDFPFSQSEHMLDIKTSVLYVSGKPRLVTLDYMIALDEENKDDPENISEFRLSYYPHRLTVFRDMLTEAFSHRAKHTIYGDFKPLSETKEPGFYIHVLEK